MPLRDHFRPPVSKKASWEGFHAMWPGSMVRQLRKKLPPGYVAEPRVHLGTLMEIDVASLELDEAPRTRPANGNGGTAASAWTATAPVVAVETDPPDEYEYEVRIYDLERERTLVAAVELVSPVNKDRPESRQSFVAKSDDAKTRWVLGNAEPWVYLNRTLIADRGLNPSDVEAALAKWYEGQTGILTAYTRTQMEKGLPADDVIGQRVSRSYRSDRAGDVMVVLKPLYLFSPLLSVLTNHGTPHPYDTHVPLLAYGPGIRKGHFKEPVTPQAIVPILARAAGIAPPATAEAPLPESLK